MISFLEASGGDEVRAFQLLADAAHAEAAAESSWMARIAREALRPVRPTAPAKVGALDSEKMLGLVDSEDAVLVWCCGISSIRSSRSRVS
ncbi:MAG TPA: hypothetical protein VGP07_11760 [Polyangia bacterium]